MDKDEVDELFGIDEETLKRMPQWFRLLREAYVKKHQSRQGASRASPGLQ